jgi:CheY-like chemotaxis protein
MSDDHAPPPAVLALSGSAAPWDRTARAETDAIALRQRRVMVLLEERARRTELIEALVGAGGLKPDRAASVLCAELGELETTAREVGLEGLAALARAMSRVIEHVAGVKPALPRRREVVVLDDNEVTRDLITLALQAEGHHVRSAACVAELALLVRERKPHVVLSEARMPDAPGARFCNYLRHVMMLEKVPIVLFSGARGDELAMLARAAGADLYLSKDQGISDLMGSIARLFDELG